MAAGIVGRLSRLYVKFGETDTGDDTVYDTGTNGALTYDSNGVPTPSAAQITSRDSWITAEAQTANDWERVCKVDASISGSRDQIEMSDDCGGGDKSYVPGLADRGITFNFYPKRISGALPAWLQILFDADEQGIPVVSVMMLDRDRSISGASGIIGNFNLFGIDQEFPLNEAMEFSSELKPSGCVAYSPPVRRIIVP